MSTRAAFLAQAEACDAMGSPFTARLCRLLARRLAPGDPVSDRVLEWPEDPGGRASALPLRLAGALHGLVLADADAGLSTVYPPNDGRATDADLWMAIRSAFLQHEAEILARLAGPPQTNEPMRCAALAPGFLTVAALTGLPLATSELGASAGLNLNWDAFSYRFGPVPWGRADSEVDIRPAWTGPTPPIPPARVAARAGCDRDPPSLDDPADRLRLLSFVWADQPERVIRVAAAIETALESGTQVERAEATEWLEPRLVARQEGRAHVVYHSILWQYLDPRAQQRALALMDAAGTRATAAAPLAWLRMEGDGASPGAAITLTLWPGGETRVLGRCGFHGAWVDWRGWG